MSKGANIWGIVTMIERHILKNGVENHVAHREILIPQIVSYVADIPMDHYGMIGLPDISLIKKHFSNEFSSNSGTLPLVWTNIYQCPDNSFVINMFRLYKTSNMPIHDHKNISGINYLLSGKINHQSYDFVNNNNNDSMRKVKINEKKIYNEKECVVTLDNRENIHCFEAMEDTSIFQILVPNYDHDIKSRPCNYYEFVNQESNDVGYIKQVPNATNYWDVTIPFNGSLDGHVYDYSQDE